MSFSFAEQDMFRREVSKHLGDLTAKGFELSEVFRKMDSVTGEQLSLEVAHPDTGRGLRIKLLRSPDGNREALTAFVHRGETGGFMVDDYLKLKGASSKVRELDLSSHPGPLAKQVDAVLRSIRLVIDHHLLLPLSGGEWPVVPMDWGRYK